jgi:hypothetical protein
MQYALRAGQVELLGCQRLCAATAWYCPATLAGMLRSLTAGPWPFAQARISPERWQLATVRTVRRDWACPDLRGAR